MTLFAFLLIVLLVAHLGAAVIERTNIIEEASTFAQTKAVGSPALGTTTAVHAAIADNGATQNVTTGITNPDVPRNLTATTTGTGANVLAISVTITGTNAEGKTISEVLPAFTAGNLGTVTGNKAFKTVTQISFPTVGNGVSISVGVGAKLGVGRRLSRNTIVRAFLNNTLEGTAPTVAFDATNVEGNTAQLNSALNGNAVRLDYVDV